MNAISNFSVKRDASLASRIRAAYPFHTSQIVIVNQCVRRLVLRVLVFWNGMASPPCLVIARAVRPVAIQRVQSALAGALEKPRRCAPDEVEGKRMDFPTLLI
jgi:hypothetical protein